MGQPISSPPCSAASPAIRMTLPKIEKPRGNSNGAAIVELLKVLLRMTSERHAVASKVIATVDDLEQIAADDTCRRRRAARLAPRTVRRSRAGAQARPAGARDRKRPRGQGRPRQGLAVCSDVFSSREPVATSLENAPNSVLFSTSSHGTCTRAARTCRQIPVSRKHFVHFRRVDFPLRLSVGDTACRILCWPAQRQCSARNLK